MQHITSKTNICSLLNIIINRVLHSVKIDIRSSFIKWYKVLFLKWWWWGGGSFSLLGGQIKVGQIYFTPGGNWMFLLLCPKCFYSPSLIGNWITCILTLYMIFLIPPSFVSLFPLFYFRLTVVPNYLRIHLITISWDLPNSNEGIIHFQYPLGVCLDSFSYRDVTSIPASYVEVFQ